MKIVDKAEKGGATVEEIVEEKKIDTNEKAEESDEEELPP